MAVADLVRERIGREGPIPFTEYMELCLYAPRAGYYTSGKTRVGAPGDFVTSPTIHPAFGALLCLALERMWRTLGRPKRFTVVEMGAGEGRLAQDILAYLPHLAPEFGSAFEYVAVEREHQPTRKPYPSTSSGYGVPSGESCPEPVEGHDSVCPGEGCIRSLSSLEGLGEPVVGCFLSNELLDSFPVHRVVMRGGRLREVYVGLEGERLVEVEGEPSTPELPAYFDRLGITLAEGQRAEVNLKMRDWLAQACRRLERGFVLSIDIGHPAPELFSARHRRGTLLGYRRHRPVEDPYLRPGEQDLIAQVDFTTLASWGEELGLRSNPWLRQREFLLDLGLGEFLEGLPRLRLGQEELYANRLAMLELIREEGLGGFGVLLQTKGVGLDLPVRRCGISELPVPRLSPQHVPLMLSRYPDYAFDAAALW